MSKEGRIEKLSRKDDKKYLGIKIEGEEWANCFDEGTIAMYDAGNLKVGDSVEYEQWTKGKWQNIKLISSLKTADQIPLSRSVETIKASPSDVKVWKDCLQESKESYLEVFGVSEPLSNTQDFDIITRGASTLYIQKMRRG